MASHLDNSDWTEQDETNKDAPGRARSGEDPSRQGSAKARKPYTITKAREKWSDDEHRMFLEGMKLYGRSWARVATHVQTKSTVQIRSHAQKYFNRLKRVQESHQAQAGPQGQDLPPPRELHAWQTPCPSAGPLSTWQTGPDGSFQRAAEIVAVAATEAAAAAAAAVVAAAGTKIREQIEAMHGARGGAPSTVQPACGSAFQKQTSAATAQLAEMQHSQPQTSGPPSNGAPGKPSSACHAQPSPLGVAGAPPSHAANLPGSQPQGYSAMPQNGQVFEAEVVRRAIDRVQSLLGQTGAPQCVGDAAAPLLSLSNFGQPAVQPQPFGSHGGFMGLSSFQSRPPAQQPMGVSGDATATAPRPGARADGPCCGDSDTIGGNAAENDNRKESSGAGTSQAFSEVRQGEDGPDNVAKNAEPQSRNQTTFGVGGVSPGESSPGDSGTLAAKDGRAALGQKAGVDMISLPAQGSGQHQGPMMLHSNIAHVGLTNPSGQPNAPATLDGASGNARQGSGGSNGSGSGSGGNNGQGGAQSVRHGEHAGAAANQHKRNLSAFLPATTPPPYASVDATNEHWVPQPPAKMARSHSSQPSSQSTRGGMAYSGIQPSYGPMPWAMPPGLTGPMLPPALAQMPPELAMALLQQQQPPGLAHQQVGVQQHASPCQAPPQQPQLQPQPQHHHQQQQALNPSPVQQQQQNSLLAAFAQQQQQQQQHVHGTAGAEQLNASLQPSAQAAWPQSYPMPMLDMHALSAVMSDPSVMAQLLQNSSMLANPALGRAGPNLGGIASSPDACLANAAQAMQHQPQQQQ